MKNISYEQKALFLGVLINLYSAIIGFVFFYFTKATSLFLDFMISFVLVISTIISFIVSKYVSQEDTKKYPLGRYAIENMFLLFRAILMLVMIIYTIFDGTSTIVNFFNHTLVNDLNLSTMYLLIYMALMTSSCFGITFVYSYFRKKMIKAKEDSAIINLEIKASIYDGLVTIFAVSSLLIFSSWSVLSPIKDIGDAITVIILSCIYLVTPIKELIRQIKVLTDKRRDVSSEKQILSILNKKFKNFSYYDVYFSYSGDICSIYICLMPKNEMPSDILSTQFKNISNFLYDEYPSCKVFLLLTNKMLHMI